MLQEETAGPYYTPKLQAGKSSNPRTTRVEQCGTADTLVESNKFKMRYSETWITRASGDHQRSLSYEQYELCSPFALAMWSP